MIPKNEAQPYPYLPDYTGTYEDRRQALKLGLKELLGNLRELSEKHANDKDNVDLLYDLAICRGIVRGMLE